MNNPYRILVLNGPNLGALGQREVEIYGHRSLGCLPEAIQNTLGTDASRVSLEFTQLNGEGELISRMEQAVKEGVQGIVLNAGAYTHTSLALADCLAWLPLPVVEVHISNVFAREKIRQRSFLARHCLGVISGFGFASYGLGVKAILDHLAAQNTGQEACKIC